MKTKYSPRDYLVTLDDMRRGRHPQWEVAAHIEAKRNMDTMGMPWSLPQRQAFVDSYLMHTPAEESNLVVQCPVCEDIIADCMLKGVDAFKIPDYVKSEMATLRARIRANELRLRGKKLQPC